MARLGVQAAEALEHAHQMGVVHRDIKPSNLMVASTSPSPAGRGAGGEGPHLWITDFGLAMVETSPNLTMTGDVLGTLRYMSPEQAEARHGVLDHRTDIYSLGLTLYELLTLRPAFGGDDRQTLFRQIADDEPRRPRQINAATPKDLETVVIKAMAKEPQSRYATAGDLADDLERFLADKPIRARRPTLLKRAAKWSRRHQAVVWSAAVFLLLATIGLGISNLLITWQKNAKDVALQDRAKALAEKQEALERAKTNEARATDEAAKAKAVVDLLQEMLGSANANQAKGADYTVRELLDHFSANLGEQLKDQPEVEAELRSTIGLAYWRLNRFDEAEPHLGAALELRRRIYGNEHEKVAESLVDYAWNEGERTHRAKGLALAREALAIYRKAGGQPEGMIHALRVVLFFLVWEPGDHVEGDAIAREALAIAQEANTMESPDVADILHDLASWKLNRGDHSEAERLARKAVALHRRVHGNEHPETGHGLGILGTALQAQGDLTAAEAHFREALAIFRKQYGDDSELVTHFLRRMVVVLRRQGKLEQAEEFYRSALNQTPNTWQGFLARASVCAAMGRKLPLADREKGVALLEKQVTKFPDEPGRAARLNSEYSFLGNSLRNIGRLEDAEKAYRKAIAISEKLTTDFPTEEGYWNQYVDSYGRLIKLLKSAGRAEEAEQILQSMRNPRTAGFFARRANLFGDLGEFDRARSDCEKAVELGTASYNIRWQHALACLGADDRPAYGKACADMLQQFSNSSNMSELFFAAWSCVLAPDGVDDYSLVIQLAERAVKAETYFRNQQGLGAVLFRAGQFGEAIETLQSVAETEKPQDASPAYVWYFLAMAHHKMNNADQAAQWLAKANAWTDRVLGEAEAEAASLPWYRRLTLDLLRTEAEGLLNVADSDKKPESPREETPETDEPNTEAGQPSTEQEEAANDE